jgi:hypothetical protein
MRLSSILPNTVGLSGLATCVTVVARAVGAILIAFVAEADGKIKHGWANRQTEKGVRKAVGEHMDDARTGEDNAQQEQELLCVAHGLLQGSWHRISDA